MVKIYTKINIQITRIRDTLLEKKIPGIKPAIRLFCKSKFLGTEYAEKAIVDTGAHISLIPFQFWKDLEVEVVAEHEMKGPIPEKSMPVNVGYVKARILDEYSNQSREIEFLSYLAFTNKVPLILGMRDLLEKFDLHLLFSENRAYLEEVG